MSTVLTSVTTPAYAMNGQSVSSEVFYAAACNPAQSACVEACAGAGKTWMLIERILQALHAGARPEQILAITFTRKAAAEMRERLQQKLHAPENKALLESVLASGHSVQIATFHAWFAQLLKAAPLATMQTLGLPLQYELLESEDALIGDLTQAFYAKVLMDQGLQADFQALILVHGRHNTLQALLHVLGKRADFELADQHGVIEQSVQAAGEMYPSYRDALEANTDAAWLMAKPAEHAQIGLAARLMGAYKTDELRDFARELEIGLTTHDFARVRQALLNKDNQARKYRSKISDEDRPHIQRAQAYLLEILAVQHQHSCWLYQQRMSRLGRVLLAEFAALKRARGLVDMPDLERAATTLLSNEALSGAIQERLDQQLRHVMIDEFQDTNPLQWQAMHAWLASYAGSGGGQVRPSLFIVGDPKQSIYRFRRAEPRVFAAAQSFMQESFDANLLSCDHTRRNNPEVLRVVNQAMRAAQEAGEYTGFRAHTTQLADVVGEGAAQALPLILRPEKAQQEHAMMDACGSELDGEWRNSLTTPREDFEETLKEKEADQAARYVAQIWHTDKRSSIMVLSKTHAPLGLVQLALQRYGVATEKQERHFLAHVPAVQDVVALLSALVSPQNNLDLAVALKSPIFAWSDAQLMLLRVRQLATPDPAVTWLDLLNGDIKVQLLRWQKLLFQLPPHDALQAIYDDSQLLNRYPSDQNALKALLWAALQQGGGRYLSAYAFVRALRAQTQTIKAPSNEVVPRQGEQAARQSVQLLTVHGAKGLEADIVLLLDSDAQAKKSESMTSVVDWPPEEAVPRKFVCLQTESRPPICAERLMDSEQKAREVEALNTLYVAMTRARQTLVLSASAARFKNPHSVWNRLEALCKPLPAPREPAQAHQLMPAQRSAISEKAQAQTAAALIPLDARVRVMGGQVADDSLPSESAQIGSAMHRLLQWQAWGDAEMAAVSHEFGLNASATQQAGQLAQSIATGAAAWLWDEAQIDWQANEYELPDPDQAGRWLRVDRLVKRRDTQQWWIVDFKSAAQPEQSMALKLQLKRYQYAVSQTFQVPLSHVQCAFAAGNGAWIHEPIST